MIALLKRLFISVEPQRNHKCGQQYMMFQGWKYCPYCGCKLIDKERFNG